MQRHRHPGMAICPPEDDELSTITRRLVQIRELSESSQLDKLAPFVPMAQRLCWLAPSSPGWDEMDDTQRRTVCEYIKELVQDIDTLALMLRHGRCDQDTKAALVMALDAANADEDLPF